MNLNLGRQTFGDPKNTGNIPSLEIAESLFNNWVKNPRLQLHMMQVATLMKCWAQEQLLLKEDAARAWYVAGLLHDADWDQWPEQHCAKIIGWLEQQNADPEIIKAIASHGPAHFGVEPTTEMDKMLYAFDELSGLIHAYALMRPGGYDGMDVKGVKKRLKEKSFAAGVNREDIADACSRANIVLEELISFIIPRQADVSLT